MHRSMMQVFVKNSAEAVLFYQKAFDTELLCCYTDNDGKIMHAELSIYGQIMAISELAEEKTITGNTMMFCFEFGEGKDEIVRKIYEVLKEDAMECSPLEKCDYSSLQMVIVDKFGVWWCIFL